MFRGGFIGGSNITVRPGDRVEYRFGQRRGVLVDAMHDGDAWVNFDDGKGTETVKWHHLCQVPSWAGAV